MRSSTQLKKLLSTAAIVSTLYPVTVAAQTDNSSTIALEEIIVTVQKRKESIQDTPISISAISADDLTARGVGNVGDIATSVPNLSVNSGPQGSSDANFNIRGVGQFDFIITTEPGVGVYLDGVYMGRTVGALLDAGDIERIEVLRGPQGTLFGRNTLGGAVSIVSASPDPSETSGNIEVTAGSRSKFDAKASVNVPLADDAAARFLVFSREQDGQSTRITDGAKFGSIDRLGGKASVKLKPSDNLTLTMNGDVLRDRGTTQPMVGSGFVPFPFFPSDTRADAPTRFYDTAQSNDPDQEYDVWGLSVTAEYDVGDLTLKSITAYRTLEALSTFDADGSGYLLWDQVSTTDQEQVSQEIQLVGTALDDRLRFLAGGYFYEEDARQVQDLCFAPLLLPPGATRLPPGAVRRGAACPYWHQDNDQTTTAYALFGQATYNLTDNFSITAGGRYSWETKKITTTQDFRLPNDVVIVPLATNLDDKLSFEKFTPKLGAEYRLDDGLLVYASYSQGFRSGGFNGRIAGPVTDVPDFDPEVNDSYELGIKADLWNRRLRANVAAFFSDYKDTQQLVSDPVVQFRTANAGDAEIYGLEAELSIIPIDNARFDLGIGYNHSELTRVSPSLQGVRVGNQMPYNPRWSVSIGGNYDYELDGFGTLTPRFDLRYMSKNYYETNNSPRSTQDAFTTIDLRLAWESPSGDFTVTGYVKNVTDRKYYIFGQDANANQGISFLMIGKPREWGLTVGYTF